LAKDLDATEAVTIKVNYNQRNKLWTFVVEVFYYTTSTATSGSGETYTVKRWRAAVEHKISFHDTGIIASLVPANAKSAGANSPRFWVGTAFSVYSPAWLDFGAYPFADKADYRSDYQAGYDAGMNNNLHLIMNFRLFKNINAHIDLGVDDWTFKRAMNIAGAIGSEYFAVQVDHRMSGNGKLTYWDWDVSKEEPAWVKDHSFYWTTVALLSPRFSFTGALDTRVGLFWTTGRIPALINTKNDYSFIDPNCTINAFGFRLFLSHDEFTEYPAAIDNLWGTSFFGPNIYGLFSGFFDIGGGRGSPDRDIVNQALARGGKEDYGLTAIRTRIMLGMFYKKEYSKNRFFSLGFGGDINWEMETKYDSYWTISFTAGWGGFVRMGLML
jgi:hypothetical protein